MTRKDYVAIAEAIAESRYHWLDTMDEKSVSKADAFRAGIEAVRSEIGRVLAADNIRFDRDRFYAACDEMRTIEQGK